MNLSPVEIKAFVPARDFELSKKFYLAVGFSLASSSEDIAYFHIGECSFLLQNFFVEEHAKNCAMHLLVENVDHWHEHVLSLNLVERFGAEIGELANRPWAMRDFTLLDPSGVLWRIAQNIARK